MTSAYTYLLTVETRLHWQTCRKLKDHIEAKLGHMPTDANGVTQAVKLPKKWSTPERFFTTSGNLRRLKKARPRHGES